MKNPSPKVLRVYAKALLTGDTAQTLKGLRILQEALSIERYRSVLFNPSVPKSERIAALTSLLRAESSYSEVLERFLEEVFEKRREKILLNLAQVFERLLAERRKGTEGTIYMPFPASEEQKAFVSQELSAYFERKGYEPPIRFAFVLQPGLLGGLKVSVDDHILDLSLQAQLLKAERHLNAEER
ncbi:MAG: F0F1 ATP synthase subunit delta [Thermotogaceae bacterium]|nr:F0F1 ATP synthase subunit delta [Thermotogaceae bacterium]